MATPPGYVLVKRDEFENKSQSEKKAESQPNVLKHVLEEKKKVSLRPAILVRTKARKGSRGAPGLQTKGLPRLPPATDATISYRKVYRFVSQDQSPTQKTLTVGNMMLAFGSVATTTTQLSSIISSFKIHSMTLWPALTVGTASFEANFEWVDAATTGQHQRDVRFSDRLPAGTTQDRPMRFVPPSGSEASFWQDGQGTLTTLAAIAAPPGSILDVDVTCTIANSGTSVQQTGYTAATVGLVYYPALDGRATNDWPSDGRPNLI